MPSWREQECEKQLRCREENESTARARAAAHADHGEGSFRCECGDRLCSYGITLTPREYALVRQHATHFAVARNHENPETERVIQENGRFATVETVTRDATKGARTTDPRQRRRERRWRKSKRSPPVEKAR